MSYESELWSKRFDERIQNDDAARALHDARRRQQDEADISPGADTNQPPEDTGTSGDEAFVAGLPKRLADYVEQTEKMRLEQENFQRSRELSEAVAFAFSGATASPECRAAFAGFDPADPDPQALEFRNYRSSEYDKFGYL